MPTHTVISDWVVIDAPQRCVWEILIDFAAYPQWNSFTTEVHTDLNRGAPVVLHVHLPKRGRRIQTEYVRAVLPPHTLAWGTSMGADFLLRALRTQTIEPITAEQCRYRSTDELHGALTPLVRWLYGKSMGDGFNNMAQELKQRAETQHKKINLVTPVAGLVL